MIFKQYYLGCLSHASYMIGDAAAGTVVVVDPQRDIEQYLKDAAGLGVSIRHVILTHFHADFVAGHLELRDRTGAKVHLGARAKADFAFEPFGEGDTIELGRVLLRALETPGHTPEGISILVHDLEKDPGASPIVLTGDTLFIGDVGRPDLMASVGITAEELAGMLYDSLHEKLLKLPDNTLVYPAHGAGSSCGKNLSSERVSTIGEQKQFNDALKPMTKAAFVSLVTADQPPAPPYFSYAAMLNRQEHVTMGQTLANALKPLSLEEVLGLRDRGAQVLDTREPAAFAAGHLVGSVNVGLDGRYASWAGTVIDLGRAIVLVCEPGSEPEAAVRLGRIGFDQVSGFLEDGARALTARPELVRCFERLSPAALARELTEPNPPLVLDVRSGSEREGSKIEGSLHIPLSELRARAGEVPRGRRVVVQCGSGYRSMIAASLLEPLGVKDLADLDGGMAAWLEAARAA